MGNIPKPFCPVSSKKLSNSKLSRGELKSRCQRQPNLKFRNFKLTETVAEYTFHGSIRVKVFDFWFRFMEKTCPRENGDRFFQGYWCNSPGSQSQYDTYRTPPFSLGQAFLTGQTGSPAFLVSSKRTSLGER